MPLLVFLIFPDGACSVHTFQVEEHGAAERSKLQLDSNMSVGHLIAAHTMLSIVVACHAADPFLGVTCTCSICYLQTHHILCHFRT